MKKLKLNGIGDMLTKDQMKQVKGGLYSTGCGVRCGTNYDCMTYTSCHTCSWINTIYGLTWMCATP